MLGIYSTAMNVRGRGWKDHQLAPFRLFMMLLPVEFRAGFRHRIAVEDPGQHAVRWLGSFVANRPVAVPLSEAFAGSVTLQVEDRHHKQLLVRADLEEQGPLL